ncbi:MAG: HD domain-containing phosphohydrolase [Actinomycetota bacterium]
MRILLVDDEPALRELLRVTLESADIAVEEAGSALEAQAVLRRQLPDLIVLDLRMPGMSGLELCRQLKADPLTEPIPIVLLTGAEPEEARAAQRSGVAALVRKPFSPLELLGVIERLSGRSPVPVKPRRPRPGEEEVLLYARDLRHLLEIERAQRRLLSDSYLETVSALAAALETKDGATRAHSQRVERYARELLEVIAPASAADPSFEYGFLLHDIGKIGIPDAVLLKAGPLTRSERKLMQRHTVIGEQMLAGVAVLQGPGLHIVRSHHERWDGKGYPDALGGEEIALGARVFAVADALDAMTSNRPYRRALSWRTARDEIVAQSGKQFDPQVVEAFREREQALEDVRRELAAA